ncbi:hypothetical protein JIN85_20585 [Luteolibacter pohnpeiensis]|uniref:Uncharacterized protein n=1 Tax=Luteolibacter pohnpeiensis TaxID=454153 RepID=A0A934SBE5_9BACT|nr:hypothetical protein [Luteolibacter pohnpeiensis]MBK1884819.1 hypothetical protein [Luteolibacter pohnpeiensis]
MNLRIILAPFFSVALSCGATLADTAKDADQDEALVPRITSLLTTSEVADLLRAGITRGDLQRRINSLPLIRIGPGYVLYTLKDGRFRLPLADGPDQQVDEWKLSKPDGTKIAEQVGAGQPATRSELDSEGDDKPQPEAEGRSR